MEFLKEIFADKSLSYVDLEQALQEKDIKLANLKTGEYVSKGKHEEAIKERDMKIEGLEKSNKEYAKSLNELKTGSYTEEQLKEKLIEVENKRKEDLKKIESEYNDFKKSSLIKEYIAKSNATDIDTVYRMLDLNEIKIDGSSLLGIDSQIEMLRKKQVEGGINYFKVEAKTGLTPNVTEIKNPNNNFDELTVELAKSKPEIVENKIKELNNKKL